MLSDPLVIDKRLGDWDTEKFRYRAERLLELIRQKSVRDAFDDMAQVKIAKQIVLLTESNIAFDELGLARDTLCHGDYQEANVFYSLDNNVEWLIDWEKCDMEPRVNEVVRAVDYMCLNGDFSNQALESARILVRAYHEVYPLVREEVEAVAIFRRMKQLHSVWIEEAYYIDNNRRPARYMKRALEALGEPPSYMSDLLVDLIFG